MTALVPIRIPLFVLAAAWIVQPAFVLAQAAPVPEKEYFAPAHALPDGQKDFDWAIGTWKIHLKRLTKPLSGSTTWVEFDGTSVCRKVWDGRANMDEFKAVDPITKNEILGLTLRLYDPKAKQWNLNWVNVNVGKIGIPTIGSFKNGRGEFYDTEEYQGRMILVRYIWSNITQNSAHFEQSFSTDGGKTWEVNWITDQERVSQ
jgi:hypothetical protein